MNIYWCLTHNSNGELGLDRCFYALFADDSRRCQLEEAEIKLAANDEPKYDTPLPLPPVEDWINKAGTW